MRLVFLVLCSGLLQFTYATNRLHSFEYIEERTPFDFSLCKNKSLFTIYDEEDARFVQMLVEQKGPVTVWLGLTRTDKRINLDDVPHLQKNLSEGEQICFAYENGTVSAFECSQKKHFMCQNGGNFELIEKEKNWCQAKLYCKKKFQDLVNSTAILEKNITQHGAFWTDRKLDQWEWRDKSCSTFRDWAETPSDYFTIFSNYKLKSAASDIEYPTICSTGTARIVFINTPRTWEEALQYCEDNHSSLLEIRDEADQEAVMNWLEIINPATSVWIGMRQSSVFGFWIWRDGIVNWRGHWKDDTQPMPPMSFQCGVINQNFTWSDENCLYELPFLCEEDIFFFN
ncbi:lymphocyte antigen 75-like [Menidia menidia]